MKRSARSRLASPANALPSCLHKPLDLLCDGQRIFVLPHSDCLPTSFLEQGDSFCVTFSGPRELGLPPFGIGHRCRAVFRTGMPKHPSTNTATHALKKTTSARHRRNGSGRACTRYLSPIRWSSLRNASSGGVSRWRTFRIRLRTRGDDALGGGVARSYLSPGFKWKCTILSLAIAGMSVRATARSPFQSNAIQIPRSLGPASLSGAASSSITREE